jgi:hypothetical protein
VKGAAADLAGAVAGLTALPSGPDVSRIFGNAAADFMDAAQSRSLRRSAERGIAILEKLSELQIRERELYVSIPEERFSKVASISDHLIDHQLVASAPLLRSVPQALGTFFIDERKLFEGQDTKKGLKETARARLARMRHFSLSATDAAENSVKELAAQSHRLTARRRLDLNTLAGYVDRVASYLDEISKLRNGSTEEPKENQP